MINNMKMDKFSYNKFGIKVVSDSENNLKMQRQFAALWLFFNVDIVKAPEQIKIKNNDDFIDLMEISLKIAQIWRDLNVINFSQVNNEIYYRASDIKLLLNSDLCKTS